jgi:LPS-assembly protein
MVRLAPLLAALALVLATALPALSQPAATLVADRVRIETGDVLIAEGSVEVLQGGVRVTARRILYDGAAGRLTIEGPITLTDGPAVLVLADQADLSADLTDGILRSARLVLDQQLQLAAAEILRVDGRYTQLSRVVTSSCQVCANRPVPLWSIRARRVVHDQVERQIYFDDAQLRVADIPVFYLPRLRFPDPTLDRATGFLFPTFRSTTLLGFGVKVPYFVTLGRSADVTLTPYLSSATRTLELTYRQAFRTGSIRAQAALTRDDALPGDLRYHLDVDGQFRLANDFRLGFGIETVGDRAYLVDYDYGSVDRLETGVSLSRIDRDSLFSAEIIGFRTLRPNETSDTLPSLYAVIGLDRRFDLWGGTATVEGGAYLANRPSPTQGDTGRDVARAHLRLGWDRSAVLGPGLLLTGAARLTAETYGVDDDSSFPSGLSRSVPEAGITLRWPLVRLDAGGRSEVLEPMAALFWAPDDLVAVPNEDSRVPELDEANLLSFSRYPGEDGQETGRRLALGLGYSRSTPDGHALRLTFGRLFHDAPSTYADGTGLEGRSSDWLVAGRYDMGSRLAVSGRVLVDDDLSVSRADLAMAFAGDRLDLLTGVTFLAPVALEGRAQETAEWAMDAGYDIGDNWRASASWRVDLDASRATRAGLGLGYRNECLSVDLSLSRRFTSSTSVLPTTDFGLSVALLGFGTGGEGGAPRRRCIN